MHRQILFISTLGFHRNVPVVLNIYVIIKSYIEIYLLQLLIRLFIHHTYRTFRTIKLNKSTFRIPHMFYTAVIFVVTN